MSPGGIDVFHIAFTFLAPEYLGDIYNRIVDSLSKIFSRMEHFEWLLRCKTPDEIIAFISYLEAKNKIIKMLELENEPELSI
jgi:mannitol/fructose-specific phosphotransferase system IIA component (Ntr-type)